MGMYLTFTIGKDKRNLVDDITDFHIDKSTSTNPQWLQARQNEDGMRQVFVTVKNEDGSPFNLTDCNYWFQGKLPDGIHKIIDARHGVTLDAQNGQFRFDMPKQAFTVAGSYVQAFFRIVRNGESITTLEFDLTVLADLVYNDLVPSDYITPFEDLYGKLQDYITKANGDFDAAMTQWKKDVADLITELNADISGINLTIAEIKTQLSALEDKIKANGLFTQAEADTFEQGILKSIFKAVQKYRTVAEMVADNTIKEGSYAETAGYYDYADNGGANYLVVDSKPATPSITLANGLYAELITEEYINVRQLGAKGDGTTDDSDIFRQAIALGAPIQVPIGQYKFNSTVELHTKDGDSVTIYGSMPISQWNTVTKKPIIISPENDYAFRGLRGKVTSNFRNICFSGYGADALSGSSVISCEFTGHVGLHDFRVSSVTLSSFHGCDVAGLQKSTDSKVVNNYFYSNQIGIDYSTSNDDITTNNKIEWNEVGINLNNAENHVISNNIFDRNSTYGISMNDFRRSLVTGNFFERNLTAHLQIIQASGVQISTNRFAFKNSQDDGTGTDLPLNVLEVTDFENIKFDNSQISIPTGGKIFKDAPNTSTMVTFDNITVNGVNLQRISFKTTNPITFATGTTTRSWAWTDVNTNLGLQDLFHGDDYHVRSVELYLGDTDPNIYVANRNLSVYTNFNSLNFMYNNVTSDPITFSHAYAILEPTLSFYTKYVAQ